MMASERLTKFYHLTFRLNGIPAPLVYRVRKAESDRLQRLLETSERDIQFVTHFFFASTDGQKVIVSLRDMQMVTFGWDIGLDIPVSIEPSDQDEDEDEGLASHIEIYFRGTTEPYQSQLDDPGDLDAAFLSNTFDFEGEPFIFFLDEDGEEVYFRPADAILISYHWEDEKRNFSLVHTMEGRSPENERIGGLWRIYAWQSERDKAWYADAEFSGGDAAYTIRYDTFGPCMSKTEAIEVVLNFLENEELIQPDNHHDDSNVFG